MNEFKSNSDALRCRGNNSERALSGKINNGLNREIKEPTYFYNDVKKSPSSKSYFGENHNRSKGLLNNNPVERLELFQISESDVRHRRYLSEKVDIRDEVVFSSKNTRSVTHSINSEDSYRAEESCEKFFQISSEAKHELSEHVKMLINNANESGHYASSTKNNFKEDKYCDRINKKRNKTKLSKKKEKKKNKIAKYDKNEKLEKFTKLQSLYDGAHDATAYFVTKVFKNEANNEKNIVEYCDILSNHSERIFKKFELFEHEGETMHADDETDNGLLDNICELFTYVMFLTLNK
ncbi:hypothetical protein, conserved [Plasmodium gonderi]|uniref:Uncharacterized protein n=1 Tax=Plasmodium gonderi TaxID=77519 RepID=A0A1Y1JLS4_PLAGO|nr:hypothetical protein, conserved [Plasmodium gonderi]GAW81772.1 hypothetical protein, conserved [Plasmodium gonderi]